MVSVSRALYYSLSILFIPRSFVLRWLPHSVLPIGIILIYFCFVLVLPSLVIILCYIKQPLFTSNNKQPLFCFCQHPTTIVCLPFTTTFRLCQHQFLLMSNSNFLLTTPLANHVSRNQFVNYCLYVFFNNLYHPFHLIFQQPFTFLQPLSSTIFVLFLQIFVNKQPINSFFQQPAFQPNLFISIQPLHFLVSYRSSLNFFGQTCHFNAKSSGGAM